MWEERIDEVMRSRRVRGKTQGLVPKVALGTGLSPQSSARFAGVTDMPGTETKLLE